jgi:hypothetical protein
MAEALFGCVCTVKEPQHRPALVHRPRGPCGLPRRGTRPLQPGPCRRPARGRRPP